MVPKIVVPEGINQYKVANLSGSSLELNSSLEYVNVDLLDQKYFFRNAIAQILSGRLVKTSLDDFDLTLEELTNDIQLLTMDLPEKYFLVEIGRKLFALLNPNRFQIITSGALSGLFSEKNHFVVEII